MVVNGHVPGIRECVQYMVVEEVNEMQKELLLSSCFYNI